MKLRLRLRRLKDGDGDGDGEDGTIEFVKLHPARKAVLLEQFVSVEIEHGQTTPSDRKEMPDGKNDDYFYK